MNKALSLILVLSSVNLYAGTISHTDYTAGGTITASLQNSNENTIVNEFNGNIDNTNIKTGGISSANIATGAVSNSKLDAATQQSLIPAGTILPYGGSSVPTGYLFCDGSAVSRATYAALFTAIGIHWGNGDASTTFNLPDLRGKFARGLDNGAGNDPDASSRTACNSGGSTGDGVGTCQADQLKNHTHTLTDPGHNHTEAYTTNSGAGLNGISIASNSNTGVANNNAGVVTTTNTTGISVNSSGGGNETRPKNVDVLYIIKT